MERRYDESSVLSHSMVNIEDSSEGKILNNRYRVLCKIGAGDFADVYLAEDITTHFQVALKIQKSLI
jgi:serine/threonine protein kinase